MRSEALRIAARGDDHPGLVAPPTVEVAGALITRNLVARLTPMLRRMAQRSVPLDQVEDVVQETWLSALRSASRYEGRSSLSVWIVGILKRRIADSYRRPRTVAGHPCENALACDAMPAPERMQHVQQVEWVERSLAELPELERAAVRLCDFQGVGRAEAARSLGIRPGYLRVALHRAHHKLADQLRKHESIVGARGPGRRAALAPRQGGNGGAQLVAPVLHEHAQPLRFSPDC